MTAQTILPANSVVDSGFNVDNSARFDGSSYLHRTPSATGNPKKWTYSVWVKMAQENPGYFLAAGSGTQSKFIFGAYGGADIDILTYEGYVVNANTARLFRDSSAWYHMVLAVDTTQSAAANGVKLYINGVLETLTLGSVGSENGYTQDTSLRVGTNNEPIHIGRDINDSGHWKGYMAECALVNDAQLAPTSFGEFDEDSGIWKPIDISGLTFGTNGFHLDFKDSSAFGNDVSGNNNDFTVVGLAATDQSTDTCTNNFATLNPLSGVAGGGASLTEGNLELNGNASDAGFKGTIGVTSGKWYWEIKAVEASNGSDRILVATENVRQIDSATDANSEGIYGIQSNGSGNNMNSYTNGTFANNNSLQGYDDGAIISVALDMDNHELYFAVNGTYKNLANSASDPAARTNPMFSSLPSDGTFMLPYVENRVSNATPSSIANFGSSSYANSSSATDGRVHGDFEYAPPSGFFALCSKNLGEFG